MEAEVLERYARMDARLDRITAVHETQAGLITGLSLQIGRLGHQISGLGHHVSDLGHGGGDLDRQPSQLAFNADALADSLTRLSRAMQELAEAQKVTEQILQAFIKSLGKRRDGRE